MDDVLAPGALKQGTTGGPAPAAPAPVGQAPQVVPVDKVLQVIRGTYLNPTLALNGANSPLPPHRWEIQRANDSGKFVRSGVSDAGGISRVVTAPEITSAAPKDAWFISLRPELAEAERTRVKSAGEVWIDLDKNAWVVLDSFPEFEKRRLLRIPLWTSRWKVKSGGFKQTLGATFDADGLLTTDELRNPGGTSGNPWEIRVDFNWMMTFVQLQYYDVKQGTSLPVPPGVCLQATGSKLDASSLKRSPGRVGGGTCVDANGTIYVLHERAMEGSSDVELTFKFSDAGVFGTFVDLSATKGATPGTDARLVHGTPTPGPREAYALPDFWHTHGLEARVGNGPRAKWTALRPSAPGPNQTNFLSTSHTSPITFHLDDTVLIDNVSGQVTLPQGSRVTLFDRRLAFRGPFDPVVVPMWKGKLAENYLRAEDVIVTDGALWEDLTFVIEHEGAFFVLREGRVTGAPGKTACIGARQAVSRAPENPIGNFLNGFPSLGGDGTVVLHLIPDAYPGPYTAAREGSFLAANPGVRLGHLLVYVPLKVVKDPLDSTVTAANMNQLFQLLLDAATRWDQAHPANSAIATQKDYVIIPEAGVVADSPVFKLRHYFGNRADGKHKFTINACNSNKINGKPFNRSFVSGKTMSLVLGDAGPNPADDASDAGDLLVFDWFTLAHELGHVMGLPDEYTEPLDLAKKGIPLTDPLSPRFAQAHEAYPFYADPRAMMRSNKLPRLRYLWHFVDFLNNGAKAKLPESPYVAVYPSFHGGITYRTPEGNRSAPWEVVALRRLSSGRGDLALYHLGDDEAGVERMFSRPPGNSSVPGAWMTGLLMLTTKLWFNFHASTTGDFADDKARWAVVQQFFATLYDGAMRRKSQFFFQGPSSSALPRIGLLFQPRFEFGPFPNPKSGFLPPNMTESDADVVVDVVFQSSPGGVTVPAKPLPLKTTGPDRLVVSSADIGLSVMRFVLGSLGGSPNNGELTTGDLVDLEKKAAAMTGLAASSYAATELF